MLLMSEPIELTTIRNLASELETALHGVDRNLLYYFNKEGFITDDVCDDVLNPRSVLREGEKAGELVRAIKNRVKQEPHKYHLLVDHLMSVGKCYYPIVRKLKEEFKKFEEMAKVCDEKGDNDESSSISVSPTAIPMKRPRHKTMNRRRKGKRKKKHRTLSSSNESRSSTSSLSDELVASKKKTKKRRRKHSKEIGICKVPTTPNAILRYRKYLQSYYSTMTCADDKLSIAPCSSFISLAIVDAEGKSEISLDIDAIVKKGSNFILVEGHAGMGKSTLCWELCKKWDTLESLKDYKLVLLLKLRERRIQNASSLAEIFYHMQKELSHSVENEVYACEGEGVLLILDGYDEMPMSVIHNESSLIMELIIGTCLPRAGRLVTSRPSALHHREKDRHVQILGFTDEKIIQYARVAFKSEPEVLDHFEDFIFSNPVITSLMEYPVNCAIIAQVFKDIRRCRKLMPKTMTQLYSTLVLVLIRRHMIENKKWEQHSRIPVELKALPEEVSIVLKQVCELAYTSLFKENIQLNFSENDVADDFQHLGLLNKTKEMYVSEGARTSYSFLHLSIQEFLAAWHVSCHPELVDKSMPVLFNSDGRVKPHLETFGRFLAGVVGSDKFPISCSNLNYVVGCCYEAKNCSKLEQASLFIYDSCPLSNTDMYAFGYALVNANIQWHLRVVCLFHGTYLNALKSSLSDHACPEDEVKGSIVTLDVTDFPLAPLLNMEVLPDFILAPITELRFQFLWDVSVLQLSKMLETAKFSNLLSISVINLNYQICENDYLLYQSLKGLAELKKLELKVAHITQNGIKKLASTISNFHKIDSLELNYYKPLSLDDDDFENDGSSDSRYCINEEDGDLYKLVMAALRKSSLKKLETNIPFHFSLCGASSNLEHLRFEIWPYFLDYPESFVFDCLYSIAGMCRLPFMKSLEISYERPFGSAYDLPIPYQWHCDFIAVLNDSLHANPSMYHLELDPYFFSYIGLERSLPEALHTDADAAQLRLKRSASYPGLGADSGEDCEDCCDFTSCPDLSLLLSIHDIHPLLYNTLKCRLPTENTEALLSKYEDQPQFHELLKKRIKSSKMFHNENCGHCEM